MKKRYIYSALFGIPGFVVSGMISFVVWGFAAGVLWLFVFGDNPWPSYIETVFPVLFALVFLTIWLACIAAGFVIGKKLEQNPVLNKRHILVAIGLTIIPILLIVFQQWSVGNIGQKTDGQRCSDFCSQNGYPASGMPPQNSGERICSCLDHSGLEVLKVPMENIDLLK